MSAPITPAPSLVELVSYESYIEPAWVSILRGAGINAHAEFSDANKLAPYADVILTEVKPTGAKIVLADKSELLYAWQGILATRVVTVRGKNSERQAEWLGKMRLLAQEAYTQFNPDNLPYHGIGLFKEAGLVRGVDEQNHLDWSELRFDIKFNALPLAFPIGSLPA